MHCVVVIVLYKNVDAQCDELVMVVDRTKLTTLATVDVPWRNFYKSDVWDKVPDRSILILELAEFP